MADDQLWIIDTNARQIRQLVPPKDDVGAAGRKSRHGRRRQAVSRRVPLVTVTSIRMTIWNGRHGL
jgi:hypothetical protein